MPAPQSAIQAIRRQNLPEMRCIPEALRLRRPILSHSTRKTAIILHDRGPFLERINVRNQWHDGSPTRSTISRFCSSLIPAE